MPRSDRNLDRVSTSVVALPGFAVSLVRISHGSCADICDYYRAADAHLLSAKLSRAISKSLCFLRPELTLSWPLYREFQMLT